MDINIQVPRVLKAKLMLWTDISYHDMELIDQMQSIPDLESALCSMLGVHLPEPRRGILLELYVQTVLFCRELCLKKEQTSALLSILKSIHEANIETPLNNIEQCLKYCEELLLHHSVRRPPFSIDLFSFEEINSVFKYIQSNYLRHYKLYKFIFTPQVKLDLCLAYSGMEERGLCEDSSEPPDVKDVTDKEEAESREEEETSTAEEEAASNDSVDLKALIEQEVSEQMKLVSRRLDDHIRELASNVPPPGNKTQKLT